MFKIKQKLISKTLGGMRKGISMIEVIIVIVVLAGIIAFVYAEVMDSKVQADIKTTIGRDMENIFKAAGDWKVTSSNSDSTFLNLSTDDLETRLPAYMPFVTPNIKSSGWKNGCTYAVSSCTPVANCIANLGDSFMVTVDCTAAATQNAWTARNKSLVETIVSDAGRALSSDKNTSITNTVVGDAKVVVGKLLI